MSAEAARYDEWLGLFANRNEVADWYAEQLAWAGPAWEGWTFVNHAILRRWSMAGLRYIKTRAWRLASATAADAASKPKTGLGDGSEIHRDGGEPDVRS